MAKPGSRQARAVANGQGVPDLGALGMSDEQAWKLQAEVELAMGKRCAGCGRRIGIGLRFVSIDVTASQRPTVTLCACARKGCDAASRLRESKATTFMEAFEVVWLDEVGVDAPSFGLGTSPHDPTAPGQRKFTASRVCNVCRRSLPLPKSDEEHARWGEHKGGYKCPDCMAADGPGSLG